MARRRDARAFGPGPYILGLRRDEGHWGSGFPFDVPAIATSEALALDAPITLLAGGNGTGKSTVVEAIAAMMGFGPEGGELERSGAERAYDDVEAVGLTRAFLDAPERFVRAALEALD